MKGLKIAVLAAALAATPIVHALDVEPYIRKDKFEQILISPKGEFFAATVPLEKQTILAIIRRSDNKVLSRFGMGENTVIGNFRWVNPARVLFTVGEKFGALDSPSGTGEIYGIDAKEGAIGELLVGQRVTTNTGTGGGSHIQAKKVEQVWADIIDDLPGDDRSVVLEVGTFGAEFPRVEKMDVYSGRRIRLASAPIRSATFSTDNAGVVRFAHGADYDRAGKLYYRDGEGSEWRLVNDESVTGLDRVPAGFSSDNRTAYLVAEADKGPDHLVTWDPATDKVADVLVDPVVDPEAMITELGSEVPVGAFFNNETLSTRFFDTNSRRAKVQARLEEAFPGQHVYVTSETADGGTALVRVGSSRNPGDYYLFDTKLGKANYLLSNGEWFDPERMNPTQAFEFAARDGLKIHGYMTRPRGSEGKRLPMVLLPHGGPFGVRDDEGFDAEVQMLASAGYAVMRVNYRGSSGYGRSFSEAGRKQWGLAMQDDLTDATRWAISSGQADAGRICIYGGSYGAYAALMGVAKEPTLYRCAVGYSGVYDLPTMYTDGDTHTSAYGKNFLADWVGSREEIAAVSPTRMAARSKVPVFLAAGGKDERAPIGHSKLMEKALISAGTPVETLYIPTEGHGFYTIEHRREFYTKLLAFLARNIGGETATPPVPAASASTSH
ncbi:alpha/beta hydrolase family protein [Cognatilysobacter lacus]|uniref:S9 family peptidase n=1 Tax=Cognatilysobacter lacus TaxID=1643323 RepID=A0A5D8Z3F3_9GAMM|nr:S9 family peptidase [Lysobacter lacus]TZF89187.1 S9 family peptidase [Lysobacter lacus]